MTDTADSGPVLAADGRPLKASLNRALRRSKMRAMLLIAPLLLFITITFVVPIGQMLFRSVENQIVSEVLPRTTQELASWDAETGVAPDAPVFSALLKDMMVAVEKKQHTRLGSRLNYEMTGISSMFRKSGRKVDDLGEGYTDQFVALDPAWEDPAFWADLVEADAGAALPRTQEAYQSFAETILSEDGDIAREEQPWHTVYLSLYEDLSAAPSADLSALPAQLTAAQGAVGGFEAEDLAASFADIDDDWVTVDTWQTIQTYSPAFTNGYFLNSVDREKTPDGSEWRPEDQQIYLTLFVRTLLMSLTITASCILLGYPVAWLLANLPMRQANLLMILVLLPFWTSLLVRTSAWKVLLQQQGVINEIVVWLGLVADDNRLALINNATGTIIAMTHILLPFMILPLYSVMKTIPPAYLRAAKSLGATNWTAFWRVYFPQSVPGIGAGSILVFILSIGYYITPEIVGGTKGVFISNRIAYHISSSLNWGLAAALGAILLAVVLLLYWAYDRIVGIDNVKLGAKAMTATTLTGQTATPSVTGFTVPITAAFGGFFGLFAGQATSGNGIIGILFGAVVGALIAYILVNHFGRTKGRWGTIILLAVFGGLIASTIGVLVGAIAGALLSWCAYWLHSGGYRASVPPYATTGQVLWHNSFKLICGLIFFFLIAPIIIIIPLSFNALDFFTYTPGMLALDPEAYSLKHYRDFFTNDDWLRPLKNSLIIAPFATAISVSLGTLAAIGLSQSHVPFRRAIMAILISPMIVPLIISATGMFFFYSQMGLFLENTLGISKDLSGYIKVILAHAALGIPFVIITVTATLVGFDNSLTRAAANMGATPTTTFFKVQMPLILPGVISGALFAFITSFDEVVVVLFVGAAAQKTLPWQMFTGLREQISPTILAVATILVLLSILLLATVELLRRRSERLRGMSPA